MSTMQAPMISSPLKQTNEIDWIAPLKSYIRHNYGDDPDRYSEECAALNRLRQDMRGAGKDSASGRDLLYRYYGQLELLDLRFPVDENHIKISFTWFDAFTHKPTTQHSLAFEKASIIFNIAAVLSCLAATQNRHEEVGLKTAYHSYQASAGMFTYINENFLHAPSTDLHHDTVRTLIGLTLAQAQEIFLEKQIRDGKKPGLIAKLASQAAYLYAQAVEGVQENVTKAVFEKVWLLLTQTKSHHLHAVAQYWQALADADSNAHGTALGRLQAAEKYAKEAGRAANTIPSTPAASSNLGSDTSSIMIETTKRQLTSIQEKTTEFIKDNDFIYHQPITSEASLPAIAKMPAAKAISVTELYQGQDINRIIGPDIFLRIVPMSITESASLYDEEKAKLIRAESERADAANSELAASLDYLKLPSALNILKGGANNQQDMSVDDEFASWCHQLASHSSFTSAFDTLATQKSRILELLEKSSRSLDMEASVCEKMRSKYGGDWIQQPSSRLTSTLRSDIRNYHSAIEEASSSDNQLQSTMRQYESDFAEMRSAGEADEADILYQRAMSKAGGKRSGSSGQAMEGNLLDDDFSATDDLPSVPSQIEAIEAQLHKLELIKRERMSTLKDLKEKIHADDISQVLIVNKKSVTVQEAQLFKTELEKFRPYQSRLLQASHKQHSVLKDLKRAYAALLQDKRVKGEQSKYESFARQKGGVMNKYRKVFQAFSDLQTGLERAKGFYSEMVSTAESLWQNVETFVRNRKAEGGELLGSIESLKATNGSANTQSADTQRQRIDEMMDRMNVNASPAPKPGSGSRRPAPLGSFGQSPPPGGSYNPAASPPLNASLASARSPPLQSPGYMLSQQQQRYAQQQQQPPTSYNPSQWNTPVSPPPHQQNFSAGGQQQQFQGFSPHQQIPQQAPQGYNMPPLPPGPPPGPPPGLGQNGTSDQQQQNGGDPWAGLSGWR